MPYNLHIDAISWSVLLSMILLMPNVPLNTQAFNLWVRLGTNALAYWTSKLITCWIGSKHSSLLHKVASKRSSLLDKRTNRALRHLAQIADPLDTHKKNIFCFQTKKAKMVIFHLKPGSISWNFLRPQFEDFRNKLECLSLVSLSSLV